MTRLQVTRGILYHVFIISSASIITGTHSLSSSTRTSTSTSNVNTNSSTNTSTSTNPNTIHTLLLCRHGDSIWNGGQPGTYETFTGWTDVPLSAKGITEASNTGRELSSYYTYGIDCVFTSILGRAVETAHHCMWAFAEQPQIIQPRKYVSDYRLNERHYGSLQGLIKRDVENGVVGDYDYEDVVRWRRKWGAIPPLLDDDDPRRVEEVKKYRNFCGGAENVPRGESLEMVAKNRIRPFLDDVLHPMMEEAAAAAAAAESSKRKQQQQNIHNDGDDSISYNDSHDHDNSFSEFSGRGSTGLVIAHANSLRALIGEICNVENDSLALQRLEAMKIQTGVPLVMKYQRTIDGASYRPCAISISNSWSGTEPTPDLPVWPLSSIPRRKLNNDLGTGTKSSNRFESQPIRIDVI